MCAGLAPHCQHEDGLSCQVGQVSDIYPGFLPLLQNNIPHVFTEDGSYRQCTSTCTSCVNRVGYYVSTLCMHTNQNTFWKHKCPHPITFHYLTCCFAGYDPQVPIDSMQGLDLGSQSGNQYGPMDNLDIGPHGDLSFGNMDSSQGMAPQGGDNQPPGMGQQWFDTDL